jgi:hypothetical protein
VNRNVLNTDVLVGEGPRSIRRSGFAVGRQSLSGGRSRYKYCSAPLLPWVYDSIWGMYQRDWVLGSAPLPPKARALPPYG